MAPRHLSLSGELQTLVVGGDYGPLYVAGSVLWTSPAPDLKFTSILKVSFFHLLLAS